MKASRRSGVSTGWNWVSCGRSCCGPPIWSTTRSWWRPWSSSSTWSSPMTWSMSRVMRSSVDRPSTGMAAASRGGLLEQRPGLGAAGRRRVLEAIGVAVVAVERGGRRVELEDALPEAVGELVDGRGRVGHGRAPPVVRERDGHAGGRPRSVAVRVPQERGAGGRQRVGRRGVSPARTAASARPSARSADRGRGAARGSRGRGGRDASQVRRWSDFRMCQPPSSIAWRRSGDRSSL